MSIGLYLLCKLGWRSQVTLKVTKHISLKLIKIDMGVPVGRQMEPPPSVNHLGAVVAICAIQEIKQP